MPVLEHARLEEEVDLPQDGAVLALLYQPGAPRGQDGFTGEFVHVGGEHDVDPRVAFRQAAVCRQPQFGDEDHRRHGLLAPQPGQQFRQFAVAVGKTQAAGRRLGHRLRATVGGEADDADPHPAHLPDHEGRQDPLAGAVGIGRDLALVVPGGIVEVGRQGSPGRQGMLTREQLHEATRAIDEVPVAGGEGVDTEGVEDRHQGRALGEEGLGGALQGVAGIDQEVVRVGGAQFLDAGEEARQPPLGAAVAIAAQIGAGEQVTVDIAHVQQGHPGGGRGAARQGVPGREGGRRLAGLGQARHHHDRAGQDPAPEALRASPP